MTASRSLLGRAARITRNALGIPTPVPVFEKMQPAQRSGVNILFVPDETCDLDGFAKGHLLPGHTGNKDALQTVSKGFRHQSHRSRLPSRKISRPPSWLGYNRLARTPIALAQALIILPPRERKAHQDWANSRACCNESPLPSAPMETGSMYRFTTSEPPTMTRVEANRCLIS
jgi:hypothetical protein